MDEKPREGLPQFATAEYANPTSVTVCKACGQPLGDCHYQVNAMLACARCVAQLRAQLPKDSHAAFIRGVFYGAGGAMLGLILYVAVALMTGLVIGFVSLAVGFIVGKAIMLGSRGLGGRRYQVAAVLLTYSAVSLAAVPIAFSLHSLTGTRGVGALILLGLASPLLELRDPMHGIIGIVILFVGIRIAWKITAGRQMNIIGPIHEPVSSLPI